MTNASKIAELNAYGCSSPEHFVLQDIPRHAEFYGMTLDNSYESLLGEHVALSEVRAKNFTDILSSGIAAKAIAYYEQHGLSDALDERPLVVIDDYVYRMRRTGYSKEHGKEYEYFDPLKPLVICNFTRMSDKPFRNIHPFIIGRPNSEGMLWLNDGVTKDDYDVVADCFKRLITIKSNGLASHLCFLLQHILVPHNLNHPEHPFVPGKVSGHGPVDYKGIAS